MYGYEVARACRWSPAMMTASKAAGYKFKYGSKTTILHYLEWRFQNPDFKITSYVRAHSSKGLSQQARGRPVANVHNSDEQ